MNRQEAIRILKKELEITKDIDKRFGDFPEHREALEMAISSLEAEPCEDCISRQLVLDKIQRLIDAEGNCHDENGNYLSYAQERVNSYEAIQQFVECEFLCPSVYPKSDAIPRERIEQMVAEIKDRRSKHNCSCSDCLDIIDKYTKEAEQ